MRRRAATGQVYSDGDHADIEAIISGSDDPIDPVGTFATVESTFPYAGGDIYVTSPDVEFSTPRPGILWFHGGGFVGGSPADPANLAFRQQMASAGIVVMMPEYQLGGTGAPNTATIGSAGTVSTIIDPRWQAGTGLENGLLALEDAYLSHAAMLVNLSALNIDPSKVFVGGGSAGSFLATALAYGHGPFGVPRRPFAGCVSGIGGFPYGDPLLITGGPPLVDNWIANDTVVEPELTTQLHEQLKRLQIQMDLYPGTGGHPFITPALANNGGFVHWIQKICNQRWSSGLGPINTENVPVPPAGKILLGASAKPVLTIGGVQSGVDNAAGRVAAMDEVDAAFGFETQMFHIYEDFSTTFPRSEHIAAHTRGKVNFWAWKPKSGATEFTWASVAAGVHDAYLISQFDNIAAWGVPVLINPAHEPDNLATQQWDAGPGYAAEDYAAMYKRMIEMSRARGATNISWVWATATAARFKLGQNPGGQAQAARAYPLDDAGQDTLVDWVGFTGYNVNGSAWTNNVNYPNFATIFDDAYNWAVANHPGKPIMIGEYAALEDYANPEPLLLTHHAGQPGTYVPGNAIEDLTIINVNRRAQQYREVAVLIQTLYPWIRGIAMFESDINKPWALRYLNAMIAALGLSDMFDEIAI